MKPGDQIGTDIMRFATRAMAALAALIACAPVSAQTSCSAANRYTLDWDAQTPKNSNLGTGSRNFTVTNGAGGNMTVTMSFAGDTTHYIDSGFGQTPNISVQNTGDIGASENTLFLAVDFANYTANLNLGANVAAVRFGFSVPVREVTFRIMDVDYSAGQFRDWVQVSGTNGASSYIGALSTPFGRNNTTNPGVTAPGVTYVGPGTVSGATITNGQLSGTGASSFTQNFGNIIATFAQPVTQVEVRYGNGPSSTMGGTAGIQSISIHDISFCPMPNINVVKTSAPVATSGINAFNIPGADVDYTITVTNTGGSTVDINSATIGDVLPSNVTFYNGDIDTGTAGTQNFVFTPGTSGLTLSAADVGYSNNGGTTYAYTPASGYDTAVNALRFLPQGTMAANSSFSVRFRARVK